VVEVVDVVVEVVVEVVVVFIVVDVVVVVGWVGVVVVVVRGSQVQVSSLHLLEVQSSFESHSAPQESFTHFVFEHEPQKVGTQPPEVVGSQTPQSASPG
jgi:hypothetical protein